MYLKKIEIYGFKSFADKIQLEFESGITAVVGPNGSGKSNIADAVRWVLGEQSAKSLRGSKMEDVIFSGTQTRKPLGYAEVSLVIDNSSDILPIDYDEVRITRRVFRSGESEFYINKTACRLKDIHQLLMDTGLGKEGYSLIGQGKIDEILSANSQDRRYVFEEAAGIVKYKSRKNEAEKKLEKTDQNLVRILDITKELEKQIDPLSLQAEEAKKYLLLKNELKEKELAVFIYKIDSLEEKQMNILKNKQDIEDQISEKENLIQKSENINNELKEKLKNKELEINKEQNNLYNLRSKLENTQSEIKLFIERNEYIKENEHRVSLEINENTTTLNQYQEEIKGKTNKLDKIRTSIKEQSDILKEKKEKFYEIKNIVRKKEDSVNKTREEKLNLINGLADLKSSLNGLVIMSTSVRTQHNQMQAEYDTYKEQIEHQNLLELKILENKKILEKKQVENNDIKDVLSLQLNERNKVLNNLQEESQNIYKKIQIKQSKSKVLKDMEHEYEGYYNSVRKLMLERKKHKNLTKNIHGVVAELIQVPSKYVTTIERALGSSIQNIVVEDEFTAQECIKLLSNNKWGRATFLPVKVIKGRKITKELNTLNKHKGFIGIASSLINYDAVFGQVIEQLLGRVIVVDKMEDGIDLSRQLNNKFKIVTLNGEVFNPGGSIVGGSNTMNSSGILSRQQEIRKVSKELNSLKTNYNNLNEKIDKMQIEKEEIKQKKDAISSKISDGILDNLDFNNSMKQIKVEKQRINNELIKIEERINIFHLEIEELNEEQKECKKAIHKKNQKLNLLNKEMSSSISTSENEKEKLEQLNNEIVQLEITAAKIQQQDTEYKNQISQINQNILKYNNNIQEKNEELRTYIKQVENNNHKIKEHNNNMKTLSEEKLKNEQQIRLLLEKKEDIRRKIEIHEENLKENNQQLLVSNNALHKMMIQLNRIEIEIENFKNTIYEDYKTTYNMALGYKIEVIDLQKIYSEIANHKSQISILGNINMNAIEEHQRVVERYTFLIKQQEDLLDAKTNLHEIIKEITTTMEKQFREQFNLIKKEFNTVFTTLFQGGNANIYLSEPQNSLNSGIEIEVQPPGKKLQNLLLLSGGERALTAIALLFAILKVRPTPFCILDEIEAALDESNVHKYASFLKEFSNSIQFIAVTHRKGTMEIADILYGVTMEEQGVSKLISVKLTEIAS